MEGSSTYTPHEMMDFGIIDLDDSHLYLLLIFKGEQPYVPLLHLARHFFPQTNPFCHALMRYVPLQNMELRL